jgi:hypothetical protein
MEMNVLLEGGNWQNGSYAGYFYITASTPLFGYGGRAYPESWWRGDDERYDWLPQRWVAIMRTTNKRKCDEVVALLEEKERKWKIQ